MLGLVMLIRKVLSDLVLGRPHRHFSMALLQLYMGLRDVLGDDDVPLPTKYLSRWICPIIGHMGGLYSVMFVGQHLLQPLKGLQIPSDLELFMDPYSIGALFHAPKATIMITGVCGDMGATNFMLRCQSWVGGPIQFY